MQHVNCKHFCLMVNYLIQVFAILRTSVFWTLYQMYVWSILVRGVSHPLGYAPSTISMLWMVQITLLTSNIIHQKCKVCIIRIKSFTIFNSNSKFDVTPLQTIISPQHFVHATPVQLPCYVQKFRRLQLGLQENFNGIEITMKKSSVKLTLVVCKAVCALLKYVRAITT